MCTTCGCASGETKIGEASHHTHRHVHRDGTAHSHAHEHAMRYRPATPDHGHAPGHDHEHTHPHDHLHYGEGPAGAHAPGMTQARMVQIEQDILSKNDSYARDNRRRLLDRGIFAINLVSSPGSGKTTLLVRTIEALKTQMLVSVIEGDQQTEFDAERIRTTGVPALQINTGKGCHLDACMVGQALDKLAPPQDSLLLIENVGNLVCPAAFDLGEAHKVAALSVTEGEDKPLKYPDMFRAADLMVLNKCDLLPYVSFDADRAVEYARRVNPKLQVVRLSATTGEGMQDWLDWLTDGVEQARAGRVAQVDALQQRIAELEAQLAAKG